MNQNTISINNANLAKQFEALEKLLSELRISLSRESDYPIFVNNVRSNPLQRQAVIRALTVIHYDDDQEPNEVIQCPALVGASAGTLALAARINQVKAELHETLKALDGVEVPSPAGGEDKVAALKVALRRLGHARLQRRQATRRIETIDAAPETATFTWSNARRKQALSAGAVRDQLLQDLADAGREQRAELEAELRRLDGLDDDTPLVRLFAPYRHPRVNLVWQLPNGGLLRKQRRAVVPLLYPARPGDALPVIRPLPMSPGEGPKRIRRRDALVEEMPLLPSLGIHRVITAPCRAPAYPPVGGSA